MQSILDNDIQFFNISNYPTFQYITKSNIKECTDDFLFHTDRFILCFLFQLYFLWIIGKCSCFLCFKEIQWFKGRKLACTQFYWYHPLRAELMAESLNNTIPLTCSFVHPEKMWNTPLYRAGLEKKNVINYLWRNVRKSIHYLSATFHLLFKYKRYRCESYIINPSSLMFSGNRGSGTCGVWETQM